MLAQMETKKPLSAGYVIVLTETIIISLELYEDHRSEGFST